MKRLTQYINESLKTGKKTRIFGISLDERSWIDNNVLRYDVDEFFDGTIVEPIYNWAYIDETLKTHDFKSLVRALQKTYDDVIHDIAYIDTGDDKNTIYVKFDDEDCVSDEKFKKILAFFNYILRNKITNKHSDVYGYWCIEPIYSKKVEKETLKKYNNLCYHYTTKENVDSILKNGLRIKKSKDFGYPERIYVMLVNKKDVFSDETIRFVKKQIGSEKVYKEGGLTCVQVNLNKISIDVYKDTTTPDDNTYFIYNNIPSSCLKLVDK